MQNIAKRLTIWAIAIVLLLMIPLTAMQFSQEVNWDLFDFVLMGAVLFAIGLAYELIARRSQKTLYRTAFVIGLVGAFLLFWINGAVGIIGNEGHPANLMYGVVFLVGLIGSLIARFKPRGMAFTLFTAAFVQILIPIIALFIWPPVVMSWTPGLIGVFALNSFFAILFIVSAVLFQRADVNSIN
ncbi:MAG: hypothetical protein ACOZAJ_01220 [Patescibacteria group bacterium]